MHLSFGCLHVSSYAVYMRHSSKVVVKPYERTRQTILCAILVDSHASVAMHF